MLAVSYAIASYCANGSTLLSLLFLLAISVNGVLLSKMLACVLGCIVQKSAGRFCFAGSMLQDIAIYSLKPLIMKG